MTDLTNLHAYSPTAEAELDSKGNQLATCPANTALGRLS